MNRFAARNALVLSSSARRGTNGRINLNSQQAFARCASTAAPLRAEEATALSRRHRNWTNIGSLSMTNGTTLKDVHVRWEQLGDPHAPDSRTIMVMPSFSHTSHISSHCEDETSGWWEFMVGKGKYIDTKKWRVICPTILGSPASPTSLRLEGASPDGPQYLQTSMEDLVNCHAGLMNELGLDRLHAVVGNSLGGMQTLQFGAMHPERTGRVCSITGTSKASPGSMAIRFVQRAAIEASLKRDPNATDGLYLARLFGTMSYRSVEEFNARFDWEKKPDLGGKFEVESYLHYQGTKFAYDPYCYLNLSNCMNNMDIGSFLAGSIDDPEQARLEALSRMPNALIMGVAQDFLVPITEQRYVANTLRNLGKDVRYVEVDSMLGHDSIFAIKEKDKFGPYIKDFLEGTTVSNADSISPLQNALPSSSSKTRKMHTIHL